MKYGNQPTFYSGERYASKLEASRARELDMLVTHGVIRKWERQPQYVLAGAFHYRADFELTAMNGDMWAEDVKGAKVHGWAQIIRMWRKHGPHPLIVLSGSGPRWKREIIMPENNDEH